MTVSVLMITYNHESYITQSILGVLNQEVNRPIELIICDDYSTDNTLQIIDAIISKNKNHHTIRLLKNSKNIGAQNNFNKALEQCKGEYIATCEGDDYWIDHLKLQKQIDFMEANPDYKICWTNYKISENEIISRPYWYEEKKDIMQWDIDFNNFSAPYCTMTLTSFFKRDCLDIKEVKSYNYFKDNSVYFMCLSKGKGRFLNFDSAVYRIHESGIYSLQSDFKKALSNYTNYQELLIRIPESNVKNILARRDSWKRQYLMKLNELKLLKVAKYYYRFKLDVYFKYLNFYYNGRI